MTILLCFFAVDNIELDSCFRIVATDLALALPQKKILALVFKSKFVLISSFLEGNNKPIPNNFCDVLSVKSSSIAVTFTNCNGVV